MIAFTAKRLYTPLARIDDAVVLVKDGSIESVRSRSDAEVNENAEVIDFGDCVLSPGFIDMHIHGAGGHDVMHSGLSDQTKMETFLASRGVTSYYPTTVTAPVDTIQSALERLAQRIESAKNDGAGRAQPLGIHLEGPFLSHTRRGMHPPENLMRPTLGAFEKFWQAARGQIRVMTIAPELEGANEVIAEASKRGVCVSLGHSNADIVSTRKAVTAGARHSTHTFNAMRPLDHREPGIIGEVLTDTRMSADVIADGIHVAPAIVNLVLRAKGPEGTVLITDATSAAGMPDGRYYLGPFEIDVKDGRCLIDGKLAGSVLTLDQAVRNAMKFARWELQNSIRAATLNPAKVTNAGKKGIIARGADADFVVLTTEGEVRATVVKGAVLQ
jgi:N-acetylglucosamine-6-phosphate deacetylase